MSQTGSIVRLSIAMDVPHELVERLRAGDPAALNDAYQLFHGRLYSYLRRASRNAAVADDLFQETWLKAARHAHRLEPNTNLEAWLFTIARNTFLSQRRWQSFDLKRARAFFAIRSSAEPTASSSDLAHALEQLPNTDRELLLLIAETSLALEALAEVMGIRYSALRQRLSRARSKLAVILKQEGDA
jgi:RNA polymerase sigma-70 factor (ECF subfamily)